jgi:alpha-beta hydrolase superfamily lysophospholipase
MAALALIAAGAIATLAAGELLSRPMRSDAGPAPADLQAESVALPVPQGGTVRGWLVRGTPGKGAVLLLHGVRSSRVQMVGRARFLRAAGYSSLLIDLPAHGESSGERITFGMREAGGVNAALAYLHRELPGEPVGVIGVSLGGASLVFAHAKPAPQAVVLESVYPTITEAVANRLSMRLGASGDYLAPLLLWQLPLRLDISADALKPIDGVAGLGAPLLVASGLLDQQTTIAETRRLFNAAAAPKELWEVPGAAHQDLHAFNSVEYERRILAFLARTLH